MFKYLLTFLLLLSSSLFAEPYLFSPSMLESMEIKNYRRVYGGPAGAFLFLKKNHLEIKSYPDNKSFMLRLKRNQKLISSPEGKYYAVINYRNLSPATLSIKEIKLYDSSGKLHWKINDPVASNFLLSDSAPIVVGVDGGVGFPSSRLLFYSEQGEIQNEQKIEYLSSLQFSGDGKSVFCLSETNAVLKFNSSGKLESQFPICLDYRINNDGSIVALLSDSNIVVYNDASIILKKQFNLTSFRDLRFSADNNLMALLSSDNLVLIDLSTSTELWQWSSSDSRYQLFQFDSDLQFEYFIIGANNSADRDEEKNTQGSVFLLNQKGELLWQTSLTYNQWTIRYPEVRISSNPNIFSLLTAEKIEIYKF